MTSRELLVGRNLGAFCKSDLVGATYFSFSSRPSATVAKYPTSALVDLAALPYLTPSSVLMDVSKTSRWVSDTVDKALARLRRAW